MGLFDPFNLFGDLFESDIQSQAMPRVSLAQQELIDAMSAWLKPQIGKGAEPYPGELVAEIPELFRRAYGEYEAGAYGDISQAAIRDLISGKPAYEFDPSGVAREWEETYAGPAMEAWRETMLPTFKESMNIPGVMYGRGFGERIAREGSRFYGQYVAPTLFSSLQTGRAMGFQSAEAAAGRQAGALGLPYQQFAQQAGAAGAMQQLEQQRLSASYQEWLRTRAEPGWAAQTAMGFMTQPTVDWAAFREPSVVEQIAMLMSGAGAAAAGARA